MRIVAVTFGTEGDWRPMAALCHGLEVAGHDVVLLAPQPAEALARRLGVSFDALPGDMARELESAMPTLMHKGGDAGALSRILAGMATRNTTAWMRTVLRHCASAEVIVPAGLAVYVGLSCAEHLRIVAIGAGLQPVMPTREFASPFVPPLRMPGWLNRLSHRLVLALVWRAFRDATNRARREVTGQSPRRAEWTGYANLFGISPTLVPQPRDWPEAFRITGAWSPPLHAGWQPDPVQAAFLAAGEPPIYLGFGSMLGFDRQSALRVIVEALAGRRAIVFAGASGLGAGVVPSNILRIGAVPHEWLFPRVRAVVHHGGAGTTHAAARAGRPQVVVPLTGDQPFWADRVWRLGVAARPLAHRAMTADALRARLDDACSDDRATRAQTVGRSIEREDGVADAVALFDRLVAHSRPPV